MAICVTVQGSHALILADGDADYVKLHDLAPADAVRHAANLRAALGRGTSDNSAIFEVVGWLWKAMAEPVLDRLGHRTTPKTWKPWPRVWWIPTGPLAGMPIHAAGHHLDGRRNGRAVLDRVVSSYSPTAPVLVHTLGRKRPQPAIANPLVVGINEIPGLPELRFAESEAREVLRHPGCAKATAG